MLPTYFNCLAYHSVNIVQLLFLSACFCKILTCQLQHKWITERKNMILWLFFRNFYFYHALPLRGIQYLYSTQQTVFIFVYTYICKIKGTSIFWTLSSLTEAKCVNLCPSNTLILNLFWVIAPLRIWWKLWTPSLEKCTWTCVCMDTLTKSWTFVYYAFCRYLQRITNRCIMYLILNCIHGAFVHYTL